MYKSSCRKILECPSYKSLYTFLKQNINSKMFLDLEELEEELCLPGDLGAISAETGDQLSGKGGEGV